MLSFLKPPKSSEYTIIVYERLLGSSAPLLALKVARNSSKKHQSTRAFRTPQEANRPEQQWYHQPPQREAQVAAQRREAFTDFLQGSYLSPVPDKDPLASYTTQLRAAASCQQLFGIHRPKLFSPSFSCNSAATIVTVLEEVPTNTTSVRAHTVR